MQNKNNYETEWVNIKTEEEGVGVFNGDIGYIINILINKKITKNKHNESNLYRIGILSMIALMIHNIPEGILTFLTSTINIKLGIKLSIAIMMHNIPEGITIAIPLYYSTKSKFKAIKNTLISGLSEPCVVL